MDAGEYVMKFVVSSVIAILVGACSAAPSENAASGSEAVTETSPLACESSSHCEDGECRDADDNLQADRCCKKDPAFNKTSKRCR
jgi:hypothetical protein